MREGCSFLASNFSLRTLRGGFPVAFTSAPERGCAALRKTLSFFGAILQQVFQLAHEFLNVLEIHVHARESNIGDFVEFFQALHNHFADFRSCQLALGGFVHHAFDFVDDAFELGRGHRPFLAGFQQTLQNFLALEAFAAAVLLDDHVRNFVDTLVGGEAASAFQTFAAAANGVAAAAFARINHLVVDVRTERAFHSVDSPGRVRLPPLLPTISLSTISSSCLAISRNWPSDQPSWISRGTPSTLQMEKEISHKTTATATARSLSTPNIAVYAMMEPACEPTPTAGTFTAQRTRVKASTSMASLKDMPASFPPKLCDTHKYTNSTRNQWAVEYRTANASWPQV